MYNTAVQIINHLSPFWSNLSFLHHNSLKLQFYHLTKFGGETPTTKLNRTKPIKKIMKKLVKNT